MSFRSTFFTALPVILMASLLKGTHCSPAFSSDSRTTSILGDTICNVLADALHGCLQYRMKSRDTWSHSLWDLGSLLSTGPHQHVRDECIDLTSLNIPPCKWSLTIPLFATFQNHSSHTYMMEEQVTGRIQLADKFSTCKVYHWQEFCSWVSSRAVLLVAYFLSHLVDDKHLRLSRLLLLPRPLVRISVSLQS